MNRKRDLCLSAACLLLALLLTLSWTRQEEESLAARIAPKVLRFHVLANSDSAADQELKLKVRTLLLDTIYEELGENASLEETRAYILAHRTALEKQACNYMKSQGYDYPAHMELTNCYFPTKTYGDMVFPNGYYDAARVTIGEGKGHNWWCVLYPPLCFVDSAYAVVPDTSKEKLEESVGEQDYRALLSRRHEKRGEETTPQKTVKINVRFKLVDLFLGRS